MTVQIPPAFAQVSVRFRHTSYARPAFNVWGWEGATEYDTPEDAANAFLETLAPWAPQLDSQVQIDQVRVAIGQDGGEPVLGFSSAPPVLGTASRDSSPPALAVRAIKRTNLGGRRNRGSCFIPWAVNRLNVTETGNIATPTITAWNTILGTWLDGWNDPGYGLYLLHGTGNTEVPEPTRITGLQVDPIISNQVRRQTRG